MSCLLKQSTAADVMLGPFLDSTDGNTVESGLTITQPDIRLSKNGGAFAQKSAAQTLTHGENGWYPANLSTTDTNTLGILIVAVHESGALPVWREFLVVPANVYDSLILGTDFLQSDLAQWLGTAPLALSSQMVQAVAQSIGASGIGNTAFSTDTGMRSVHSGICAGVASGSITLAGGASSVNDFYKNDRIYLTSGTGVGQSRRCTGYNGTTKVATIEPDWVTNPVAFTTEYTIREDGMTPAIVIGGINRASLAAETGLQSIRSNTAQGGSSTSITLDAGASATSAFYAGLWILITSGTGAGQVRMCNGYNGTSKVATVYPNWVTDPDSTSTFALLTSSAVNAVTTIGDGAIAASSFAAGAIDATAIADGAIDAGALASDTITATKIAADAITAAKIAAGAIDDDAMAADTDSYWGKIWIIKQSTTKDEYGVTFLKNGQPIETGITVPVIDYVKKLSDGSILINDASLTDQSNGDYYYGETTNKLVAGNAYMARVTATIDGATRFFKQQLGRDSV